MAIYKFGKSSKEKLVSVDHRLERIFNEVIKIIDCSVIQGFRTAEQQKELYAKGRTEAGNIVTNKDGIIKKSMHQTGLAVDVIPYPIDWNDRERFVLLAGIVKGIASQMNIRIRWGGDWNSNNKFSDETFIDLPHYEISE